MARLRSCRRTSIVGLRFKRSQLFEGQARGEVIGDVVALRGFDDTD
jgi:hypothetical protein